MVYTAQFVAFGIRRFSFLGESYLTLRDVLSELNDKSDVRPTDLKTFYSITNSQFLRIRILYHSNATV